MHLKQFLLFFLYLSSFSIGIIPNFFFRDSILRKKEVPLLLNEACEIDNYYDSLIKLKTANILLYKELNTSSGNKGLIIWKDKNCVYGVKFTENVLETCKKEQISSDNQKLGLIALKLFYNEEKSYSVTKSKFETMHDYKIIVHAFINGKKINSEFFASDIFNNPEFLAEISRLCQDIIYDR